MGGLAIFSLIGLYFFIAYKVVKSIKAKQGKWLAIAILALVPTADAVIGRIYLQHACSTEGGLKVYRSVEGVEGFMSLWADDTRPVEQYGYRFSEGTPINGRVIRYSKKNGQIVRESGVIPKSEFRLRLITRNEKGFYTRQILAVETVPGGEVLATDGHIMFNGGWAERFLAGISDAGAGAVSQCESKDANVRYKELVLSTLKH